MVRTGVEAGVLNEKTISKKNNGKKIYARPVCTTYLSAKRGDKKEEAEKVASYKFVYLWYDDPEDPDDPEKTADDFIKEGEKVGLEGFKVDIQGVYSDLEGSTRYIYDGLSEKERKFKIDENTLVFVRAPVTKRKSWSDFLTQFYIWQRLV